MSLNQIILIGNAGRDAELRYTQSGTAVANFSMAVSRRYQTREEMREETEWFNVSAWERRAEFVSDRVKRGTRVFVDGRLSTREYTTGNGETRTSLDVNANRVIVLTPRDNDPTQGPGYPNRAENRRQSNGHDSNGHTTSEYRPSATQTATTENPTSLSDDKDDLENLPW